MDHLAGHSLLECPASEHPSESARNRLIPRYSLLLNGLSAYCPGGRSIAVVSCIMNPSFCPINRKVVWGSRRFSVFLLLLTFAFVPAATAKASGRHSRQAPKATPGVPSA